ncbi:MAG: hypothetical protein CMA67_01075 [Euryarchaeota archaeon]|nr:hypothetical protein [Euryarchaeota archaeon]
MRKSIFILTFVLLMPVVGLTNAGAESDIGLEEAGLTMVALRNDSLDLNQDGDVDAVRVVVILNSSTPSTLVDVRLIATHNDRQVIETTTIDVVGQTNASLTYDAWSRGAHELALGFYDMNGVEISTIGLPTYEMVPALQTPMLSLQFTGKSNLQTGSNCEINRMFADETGPRYGAIGTLTFTGAPFIVLDNATTIDCSSWPAGEYSLRETYRNELGQTAETSLNLTIENRPAPAFELLVTGDGLTNDRPCLVAAQPSNDNEDFSEYTMEWDVSSTSLISEGPVYDCSVLPAGVHLVVLKVTNLENIASTQAVNIVRLPAAELTKEEQEVLPSQSFGDETVTDDVGWYTIAVLGLLVAVIVFVLLVRFRENDELLTLPELGPAPQILNDGSPDPGGLPTVLDDEGQLWRKHPDGSMDWWDSTFNIWQRW